MSIRKFYRKQPNVLNILLDVTDHRNIIAISIDTSKYLHTLFVDFAMSDQLSRAT